MFSFVLNPRVCHTLCTYIVFTCILYFLLTYLYPINKIIIKSTEITLSFFDVVVAEFHAESLNVNPICVVF